MRNINMNRVFVLLALSLLVSIEIDAQKVVRDHIRKGNRQFRDSVFVDAEVNYRKALDIDPNSGVARFNLANALIQQNKLKEAMEQYIANTKIEKDKKRLAQTYHNMGVIFQSQKDYAKAIEAYKHSLRNNSKDDETRYNLALAQKMLKDQQQNQKEQNQNQQQNKQDQQKQEQNEDQRQNQQNQSQQPQKNENENEMSKENAEQLLNSVMQDERDVQDKLKKQQIIQGGRLEKDW